MTTRGILWSSIGAGVLVLLLTIIVSSRDDAAPQPSAGDAAAVLERIKPVGQLNTGEPLTIPPPAAAAPAAAATPLATPSAPSQAPTPSAPAKPAVARSGEQVFTTSCQACHGTGIAGAPKLGDKAAWAPRIKQGKEVLVQHAVQGFAGKTGVMPPRGTCGNCTDQELRSAVEYMMSRSR